MRLPQQRLPIRNKTKNWGKETIDYYEQLSFGTTSSIRNTNYNKKINYDLFNGIFNKADMEYVCNPLGLNQGEFPATFQHYDITSPVFNLLIGEESKRADNCMVISMSTNDINRKQSGLKQKIMDALSQHLMAEIDPSTVDPNNPLPTPDQILKYEKHNISDLIESKANKILKHLKKYLNTKEGFKRGWKDAILAGEEIYWTGISNKEVIYRRCNPLNITVILDGDSDYIDDAIAVMEVRMLSISSILDEMGDELSTEDLRKLEEKSKISDTGYANSSNNPTFKVNNEGHVVDTGLQGYFGPHTVGSTNSDLLRVMRVEWKSQKKLYHVTYIDDDGIPQERVVDESFKIDLFKQAFPTAQAEEFWIPEAWEGTKIGDDIYIGVKAKPNQRRRMDNPYYCKLGYVGLIYNATNSTSISLMDRIKPYQYLYNVFMYRLELTVARDKGKKFIMDISQIPRSEGFDVERWMYYFDALGIAFINSFEEQRKGSFQGQKPMFNQFTEVDLSLANVIQQYVSILDYIKQQVAFISGVTPQRLGAIENRELVGNVERSVQQSALITEYLFDAHDEVKRRVYTALIECAKIAYKDGLKTQFVLDDMGIELLELEEMELENSEFNVFISNSNEDRMFLETLKQLSQAALQRDKINLSTIADTLINNNPRDIIKILDRAEREAIERAQQHQQQLNAIEQEKTQVERMRIEQELIDKDLDRDLKLYEVDSNNETKIMVAEINALKGVEGPSDMDNDGIPDPIEVARLSLDERAEASKAYMERQKIEADKEKRQREMDVKEKEMRAKEDIEKQKIRAIDVQNKSQERMQQAQIENDRKLMAMEAEAERKRLQAEKEMHAQELKLKKEELEIKRKDLKNKIELEKIKLQAAREKAKMDKEKGKIALQKAKQPPKKPGSSSKQK
jgi:hypothetical protein